MNLDWQDLDDMVEGDPLVLRDRAWAEINAQQQEIERLRAVECDAAVAAEARAVAELEAENAALRARVAELEAAARLAHGILTGEES